jgi:hypothetical protein
MLRPANHQAGSAKNGKDRALQTSGVIPSGCQLDGQLIGIEIRNSIKNAGVFSAAMKCDARSAGP